MPRSNFPCPFAAFTLFLLAVLWPGSSGLGQTKFVSAAPVKSTLLSDTAWLDVNRWQVPITNQGSIGFLSNLVRYPSPTPISLIFDAGFAVSVEKNGQIHTAAQFLSSRIAELQPGLPGRDPQDPLFRWYAVTSRDAPGSKAFV
ncbi:MAG: hypothetical protein D6715_03395 [Calditrichaeota bacterium]|nr:MAG: hypothetical protein D6715_03395 [Calditrichota bacterium]